MAWLYVVLNLPTLLLLAQHHLCCAKPWHLWVFVLLAGLDVADVAAAMQRGNAMGGRTPNTAGLAVAVAGAAAAARALAARGKAGVQIFNLAARAYADSHSARSGLVPAVNVPGPLAQPLHNLVNLGNTCAFSSALAALSGVQGFFAKLSAHRQVCGAGTAGRPCVECSLYNHYVMQGTGALAQVGAQVPFISSIVRYLDFDEGKQADASEVIIRLLSHMNQRNQLDGVGRYSTLFGQRFVRLYNACSNCTVVDRPAHNTLARQLEEYMPLSLPRHDPAARPPSLGSLVDDFFRPQVVEDYECQHCLERVTIQQQCLIALPSRALALPLKRWDENDFPCATTWPWQLAPPLTWPSTACFLTRRLRPPRQPAATWCRWARARPGA